MIGAFGSLSDKWIQHAEDKYGDGIRISDRLCLFNTGENVLQTDSAAVQPSLLLVQTDGVVHQRVDRAPSSSQPELSGIIRGWGAHELSVEELLAKLRDVMSSSVWRGSIWGSIKEPAGASEQCVLLISDKIGSCPIYYYAGDRFIIWSDSLAALTGLIKTINGKLVFTDQLGAYLRYLHFPPPGTLIQGVHRLPPASILSYTAGTPSLRRYWRPNFRPGQPEWQASAATLRALLDRLFNSSSYTMRQPAALLLSGGLDSSLLAALLKVNGLNFETFTVGFKGENDEREDGAKVAASCSVRHHSIVLEPKNIEGLLQDTIRMVGFPSGNPSAIATYAAAVQASKHSRVLVSGLGSDELFGGHRKHIAARFWPLTKMLLSLSRRVGYRKSLKKKFFYGKPATLNAYEDCYAFFNQNEIDELLIHKNTSRQNHTFHGWPIRNFIQSVFLADVYGWLTGCLLPLAAGIANGQSMQLQVPLCNDQLLELAARMPLSHKVKGSTGKWILRKAVADLLPRDALQKRRRGFTLPMAAWLRGPLRGLLDKYLNQNVIRDRGLFEPGAVQRLIQSHLSAKADLSLHLWSLISLEIWQQIFLDSGK